MGINDFRRARHHEPPRAKRKVRVVLRNSRSRSSSHSENDAEYIMGLRKSANSREYDIIDVRFSNSTAAMAQRLRQMAEEHKSRIKATEEITALAERVAGRMKIKVEEGEEGEEGQRLDMIPEEPKDLREAVSISFGAKEALVWDSNDDMVELDGFKYPNLGLNGTAGDFTELGDTGLDWDELVPEEPSTSFDIETDDIYGLMSNLLSSPDSAEAEQSSAASTVSYNYGSSMRHTHFSILRGTTAYVPPLPHITSAAQLRMQQKEESYSRILKPHVAPPETFNPKETPYDVDIFEGMWTSSRVCVRGLDLGGILTIE